MMSKEKCIKLLTILNYYYFDFFFNYFYCPFLRGWNMPKINIILTNNSHLYYYLAKHKNQIIN